MKKNLLLLILLSIASTAFSQADVEYLFKCQLYLDRKVLIGSGVEKNDSTYRFFMDNISVKLQKMKADVSLKDEFVFYKLSIDDIKFNPEVKVPSDHLFYYSHSLIPEFILGIDTKRNKCYRLYGFDGNDFLNFLSDYKESGFRSRAISDKEILNDIEVEGLDFKCLYKALRSKDLYENRYKYPCLDKVSDLLIIY